MAAPPAPREGDEGNNGIEVCLFNELPDNFSSAVRAISELAAGEPEPNFTDAEVERLSSSVTFIREWRDYCYEAKCVSFTYGTGSTSSRDDTHEITLPRFSSTSVPQVQVTHLEDGRVNNTDSSDFILFAGGNVWSLDWCPTLCDKPYSPANCEYLAVAAHPPGSSSKIGMPLTGRGIIQVWCLVAPFQEAYTHDSMIAYSKSNGRGRPRKIPDLNNSISSSSVPRKPVGRPRKIKLTTTDDHAEPSLKRPRGRPRKYPLSVGKVLDSAKNKGIQDPSLIDPLVTSGVIPGDLALSCAIPTVKPLESTPKKDRGRPRKISKCSPVPFENGVHIIDELEDTEVAPLKESSTNSNIITCAENLNFSAIPKGIHLPRVVLCLEHDGKVAWDIKWKPPLPNQSEQKSRLGFLAILLGDGSVEVWEVPSPSMIQKIYSSSSKDGTDPRFLELRPVFRCAKVKCGNRQIIPLTVDWSPSPHDMILAGCHDGTVALWKFSADLSSQDTKPFMCVTAESVPIRALSWAPYVSEENTNTFATAGEDGLKFWDLRDPYRPLWELRTAPRTVLSLHWLKDTRGIVISLEDGTLKFLSLSRIANDVPVTGRPFAGTKTQGVSTYKLSEYLIWNVHVSEITGYAAYCGADGTAVRFQLTSRFWEKEPWRNRVPYFLCGSLAEEGNIVKIGGMLQYSPLPNVPLVAKKGPKAQDAQKEKLQTITNSGYVDPEPREGQLDEPDEGQECNALVLADRLMEENGGICNGTVDDYPKDFEVFPPKSVALHRLRWNMNKGSEKWLCYGGAAGIIRCQRI